MAQRPIIKVPPGSNPVSIGCPKGGGRGGSDGLAQNTLRRVENRSGNAALPAQKQPFRGKVMESEDREEPG